MAVSAVALALLLLACGAQEENASQGEPAPEASTEGKAVPEMLENEDATGVWADQIRAQLVDVQESYERLEQQMEELGRSGDIVLDQASQDAAEQYREALLAADQKVLQAAEASEELSDEAKAGLEEELAELEKRIAELRASLGQDEDAPEDDASSGDEGSDS